MREQLCVSAANSDTSGIMSISRVLKYASLVVIAVGASLMIGMLIWSYRLDRDFSGSYACCTQEAMAEFHRRFWARFFIGAKASVAGCLALSASLPSGAAVKVGLCAVAAGVAGALLTFIVIGLHTWTGASAMTLMAVVFCGGAALLFIGGCRLGWTTLRSHKE